MKDISEERPLSVRLSKREENGTEKLFELSMKDRTVQLRQGNHDKMKRKRVSLPNRNAALDYYNRILKRKTEEGFTVEKKIRNDQPQRSLYPSTGPSQNASSALASPSLRMSESPMDDRRSKCSQGRNSDNEYEMDYERMTQLLLRGVKSEQPKSIR